MKVLIVFGTRPEAIKMAPVVKAFQAHTAFETLVCVSGQHRSMLDQVLSIFDIVPDIDLNIMKPGQTLTDITVKVLQGLEQVIKDKKPDLILVHGDTTTAMAAALADARRFASLARRDEPLRHRRGRPLAFCADGRIAPGASGRTDFAGTHYSNGEYRNRCIADGRRPHQAQS
jgi:UDP-N-acetylglucosamine 2-epimerase